MKPKPKTQPNKKSLLELAKEVYPYHKITDEEIDLALAWVNDEIGTNQYAHAMQMAKGIKAMGGSVLYRVATVLKEATRRKKIQIKKL